jgi:hypothetical protein
MKSDVLKVVCFKWNHKGGYVLPSLKTVREYSAEHVNRLYHSVKRNTTIPHDFICITDDPTGIECQTLPMWDTHRELGGCYTRLKLFSKEMKSFIGNRFIMLDLDIVITGSLDEIFTRKEDFIINQYSTKRKVSTSAQVYNGSLIMMNAGARYKVWETFDPETSPKILQEYGRLIGTDQAWINYSLGNNEARFTNEDGVYRFLSLPRNGRSRRNRRLPRDSRLVVFSGKADPSLSLDVEWIKENWK